MAISFFVFLTILIVFSLLPFILKRIIGENREENSIVRKLINGLTICSSLLLLTTIFLSQYDLCFRGYKTTTFILIATVLLFILHYLFTNYGSKTTKYIVEFLLFIFLFISGLILFISLIGYSSNNFYSTDKYRIETFHFIKGSRFNLPDLYVKDGFLEKKYHLNFKENDQDLDNLYFNKESIINYDITQVDNQITVKFLFENGVEVVTETFLDGTCD